MRSLRVQQEADAYAAMVKDVVPPAPPEPLSAYAEQVGFSLNVCLMMFTLFMVGYIGAQGFSASPAVQLGAGLSGATGALLLETALFILRFRRTDRRPMPRGAVSSQKYKND